MIEKIIVTIATQKSRKSSLIETICSLENQSLRPTEIRIYANDYEIGKIGGIYNGIDFPVGDLADNGKFYDADKLDGYHLTCDDDLIYPHDYVEKIITAIEDNKRKAVVGFHGVIINPTPINYYYQNRTIHKCLGELKENTGVHLLGTGALGYHTSTLKVELAAFPSPYMADIHFGINAQKQNIPMICLAHKKDWLAETNASKETHQNSIFARFRRNDKEQTERVNALSWQINGI